MQLVELIKGIATDQETYESCLQVVEKLGKQPLALKTFRFHCKSSSYADD